MLELISALPGAFCKLAVLQLNYNLKHTVCQMCGENYVAIEGVEIVFSVRIGNS